MFDELKRKLNGRYEEEYEIALQNCEEMLEETREQNDNWERYFHFLGLKYKMSCQLIEDWTESFYLNHQIDELQALNKQLFAGVTVEEYATSFANPAYAVQEFGEEMGKLVVGVAAMIQPLYHKAVENQHFEVTLFGSMLIKLY